MDEPLYNRRVRVNVWRQGGAWGALKNGFTGLMIRVSHGRIEIYGPGIPKWLARFTGLDIRFDPEGFTMCRERPGWFGVQWERRERVVLDGTDHEGRLLAYAVRPADGDLDALETVLSEVGVVPRADRNEPG